MSVNFREAMSSSIAYWEPRRLVYNAVLALIVVAWFVAGWPGSKESLGTDLALGLFILAVLANVAYCAVYVPDLALQFSTFRDAWLLVAINESSRAHKVVARRPKTTRSVTFDVDAGYGRMALIEPRTWTVIDLS